MYYTLKFVQCVADCELLKCKKRFCKQALYWYCHYIFSFTRFYDGLSMESMLHIRTYIMYAFHFSLFEEFGRNSDYKISMVEIV